MSYVLMLTHHRAVDVIRTSERRRTRELASPITVPAGDDGNFADRVIQREDHARLLSALDLLPTNERRALRLAHFAELTHVQIAELTAAPLGTVKTWCRTGKKRLAILLDDICES